MASVTPAQRLGQALRRTHRRLKRHIKKRPDATLILTVMLMSGGLSLSSLLRAKHPFEADLTTTQLSFTSSQRQLFLHEIPDIQEIAVTGPQNITLQGQFTSPDLPDLSESDRLTIRINDDSGSWFLTRDNPPENTSDSTPALAIASLHLGHTRLSQLSHNHRTRKLTFNLAPNANKQRPTQPSTLELYGSNRPLTLILENVTLPNLPHSNPPDYLEIAYVPIPEQPLTLPHQGTISLTFTSPADPKTAASDRRDWIWGNLTVSDLSLATELDPGEDQADSKIESTITKGTARLGDQTLKLNLGQFLLFDRPGRQTLHTLQLDPKTSELTVRLSGETHQLQSGISRDRPLQTLQSNWLTHYVSEKGAIAILTFSTTLFTTLLSWIIANIITQPSES